MRLYLNAPIGYVITRKITKDDTEGLRQCAHDMVDSSETEFHAYVERMNNKELVKFFKDNSHTFDKEYYGVE